MSNSTNNTSSPSSSGGLSSGGLVTICIVVVVFVAVIVIKIAKFITMCVLKRQKLHFKRKHREEQSDNISQQSMSGDIATIPLCTTPSTYSEVEVASIERFLDDILNEKPIRFSPQHLIDFTNDYNEKLGSGGFGVVYKGQLPNKVQIAVKVLNKTLDKRAEEQFMAEVGTVGRTYHINLVRLYGFCFDTNVKALVYEYMENGSLDRYLFDKNHKIEWVILHQIAVGTGKGIRYLHEECQRKIVHYDIKPGNILLSANFSPKVADFGLAKLCDRENTHLTITGARGTPGYAAPELWMPFPVTHKCDVYSFGMVLFEILGKRRNFDVHQAESQEWFPRWVWEKYEQGEIKSMISWFGIEEKNREKAERMCKVALWCVQYQPETRPSMNSVVRMLEGEEEIVAPVNPFQYMMPSYAASSSQSGSTVYSTSTQTTQDSTSSSNELHSAGFQVV